jgi:hypothetical protein
MPSDQGSEPICLLRGFIVVHVFWFQSFILFFLCIIRYGLRTVCLSRKRSKLRIVVVFKLIDSQALSHIMWMYVYHAAHSGGTRQRSWLRHCATIRKVVGSIPDGVIGIDIMFLAALWPLGRLILL